MCKHLSHKLFIAFLLFSVCVFRVQAGIVIIGTRVVYPEGEKDVSIKIDNSGDKPALVQSWVDNGNPNASPEKESVPFIITPPVNRINAGKGQTLRLIFTGTSLPADKESLFWLNVLEIPATDRDMKNHLKMAVRSRLKIFYRPSGLNMDSQAVFKSVSWRSVAGGIEGHNPTPYYVSMSNMSEDENGDHIIAQGGMIEPGGTLFFATKKKSDQVYVSFIDDYGGIIVMPRTVSTG